MEYELARVLCCFAGCFLGTFLARWMLGRSLLMHDNRRMQKWIDAQKRTPDFGPHRSWDARILVGVGNPDVHPRPAARSVYPLTCTCGVVFNSPMEHAAHGPHRARPARPAPTSVPSSGRKVEE